ncbi:MAG: hypothetical protein WCQ97_03195 [Aminobacterium sp.]|jgi:hypothetical protein|uniref:hypothetical protein n=1 Tax=unclassified Aminobacterium TaxID=2685012 RepID=UPI001BCD87DB|nr:MULTISPECIES: hypothetical protein [unclassified Aminobacterium]MDD2206611.1 hypothetical protein [Aminobacterium sp.]MDD3425476.1 hypothetical protein [Aminobacterium sp.]MDD3706825.1 hypothetical protein [Aminobacterium sp.]MDD4228642.1 hypothetical protein [Aminobacterium sp.]MDD4551570.1 hypothetical protein [Aminobacterium sp.]
MDAVNAVQSAKAQEVCQNVMMATQAYTLKSVTQLQEKMMAQLFESMGIGQNLNIKA